MVLTIGYYGGSAAINFKFGIENNRVGGLPIVPNGTDISSFKCSSCNGQLVLVCQLYCPLAKSSLHRMIYITVCRRSECGNWNVFRLQCEDSNETKSANPVKPLMVCESWHESSDEWGESVDSFPKDEKSLTTGIEKLSITPSYEVLDSNGPNYAQGFINATGGAVEYDSDSSSGASELHRSLETEDLTNISANDSWQDEEYEKPSLAFDLSTFKFLTQVHKDPEQLLRYDIGGKPLCYEQIQEGNVPKACLGCGAPRQFEFQLMPNLIEHLKRETSSEAAPPLIDFATILVYTCSQNCGGSSLRFHLEQAIVQKDVDCDSLMRNVSQQALF